MMGYYTFVVRAYLPSIPDDVDRIDVVDVSGKSYGTVTDPQRIKRFLEIVRKPGRVWRTTDNPLPHLNAYVYHRGHLVCDAAAGGGWLVVEFRKSDYGRPFGPGAEHAYCAVLGVPDDVLRPRSPTAVPTENIPPRPPYRLLPNTGAGVRTGAEPFAPAGAGR